jgi:hypothetical protein
MAQTIDTLEVVFSADLAPLSSCLMQINAQLMSVKTAGDIADASLKNMAGALDFGMAALKKDANSAGQAVGMAFSKGLRSKRSAVDAAVQYLTAAALAALRRLLNMGAGAGAQDAGAASMEKFADSDLKKDSGADGGTGVMDITIPINVDGIKLGEACVRGLSSATRLTGRSVLNI